MKVSQTLFSALAVLVHVHTAVAGPSFPEFVDPHPSVSNGFGTDMIPLSTGNVVITSPYADVGATDTGAVYLFNGATGTLISTLTGSSESDYVGYGGVTVLTNGNFVVSSFYWDNGVAEDAGAVTWGSGITGINGVVSVANSIVGSTAFDNVGGFGTDKNVTALANGNYVVSSPNWSNGAIQYAGAATWGNGTTGTVGAVSAANSLVGSNRDIVGTSITALANGNYVVGSPGWHNGGAANAGAVTLGNGTTGTVGLVTSTNSLVGSKLFDFLGLDRVTALTNGNYVVTSSGWDNGSAEDVGAVTWGNGISGVVGEISSANSLIGSTANDNLGAYNSVAALSNGNYVVASIFWNRGSVVDAGAVTWGSGTTGISGTVSASNSLVGSKNYDLVGDGGVTVLPNGNYVVSSHDWNNRTGATTWGSGTVGVSGPVSSANSLVSPFTTTRIQNYSGVTVLANGNYVVNAASWDNGTANNLGAVTWADANTGISGEISALNSLVGSTENDFVGDTVTALMNGNYVVSSSIWSNGAVRGVGAVTWGDGATGIRGVVSAANSLIGSTEHDSVGSGFHDDFGSHSVTALSNGNYVVISPSWDNGTIPDAGAVTWGNGATGVVGTVSTSNSLVGSTEGDYIGETGVTALSNGNYVVSSPSWNYGTLEDAGAATWGDGTTGIVGVVSTINSLHGSTFRNHVGGKVTALPGGNYLLSSPAWSNGQIPDAGALTWGNGATGSTGIVSVANSVVGLATNSDAGTLAIDSVNNHFIFHFPGENRIRVGSTLEPVTALSTADIAVADAVTIAAGDSNVYPLANDIGTALTIVSVSDPNVTVNARKLIIPAGYTGSFTYTASDGISLGTANVVVTPGTPIVGARRYSGLLHEGGAIQGRATMTRSASGINILRVRSDSITSIAVFKGNQFTGLNTQFGPLNISFGADDRVTVAAETFVLGHLRPSVQTAAAATNHVALGAVDAAIPGAGVGRVKTTALGMARLSLKMPDGKAFSASAEVSDNGSINFCGPQSATAPKGWIAGELVLANLAKTDLTGELQWTKPAQLSGLHPAGVNTVLTATGCVNTGTFGIPDGPALATFSGGNFPAPVAVNTTVQNGKVTAALPILTSWTTQSAAQAFLARLRQPGLALPSTSTGLYFPKSRTAIGFFPGTALGGKLELTVP